MFNQKEYQKQWYAIPENRAGHVRAVRKAEKERAKKLKKWVDDYKMSLGCMICGYRQHPCALDFDHRDSTQKLFNISSAVGRGSFGRIQLEILKCDVLCSNCHRIKHFGDIA